MMFGSDGTNMVSAYITIVAIELQMPRVFHAESDILSGLESCFMSLYLLHLPLGLRFQVCACVFGDSAKHLQKGLNFRLWDSPVCGLSHPLQACVNGAGQ